MKSNGGWGAGTATGGRLGEQDRAKAVPHVDAMLAGMQRLVAVRIRALVDRPTRTVEVRELVHHGWPRATRCRRLRSGATPAMPSTVIARYALPAILHWRCATRWGRRTVKAKATIAASASQLGILTRTCDARTPELRNVRPPCLLLNRRRCRFRVIATSGAGGTSRTAATPTKSAIATAGLLFRRSRSAATTKSEARKSLLEIRTKTRNRKKADAQLQAP